MTPTPKPEPASYEQVKRYLNYHGHINVRMANEIEARIEADRARIRELEAVKEQHNRLCLAELGGDGVWPCGCHHLIVDSYGSRKLLTAADGEIHQECDDHAELRAELATAREHNRAKDEEIARLERGLRSISANTCCDRCQEAALVARAALAEQPKEPGK